MTREILKDVPLYHIKPYERNYQNHTSNVQYIANSIQDLGYNKVSITVDEDMVMLTGHGTLAALEKLDYKQVPMVLQITGLTENQKKAFRIADNESSKDVIINDEFLRLEIEDLKLEFDMGDYGFKNLDLEDKINPITDDDLNTMEKKNIFNEKLEEEISRRMELIAEIADPELIRPEAEKIILERLRTQSNESIVNQYQK